MGKMYMMLSESTSKNQHSVIPAPFIFGAKTFLVYLNNTHIADNDTIVARHSHVHTYFIDGHVYLSVIVS